ncbi:MAG: GH92 family glycosyl hydrolase [Acidobacteriota bacterium]
MVTRRDVIKGACATGALLAAGSVAEGWPQAPSGPGSQPAPPIDAREHVAQFVDPLIGTGGHGHTFPGAVVPFGMVQLSPDSGRQGGDWCAGYHYSDTELAGFSHTHLSGTGIGDLCDILVTPLLAGPAMPGEARLPFSHDKERAAAGYYRVDLATDDILAEMTATRRVGIHRYTFRRYIPARPPALTFDLGFAINWDQPVDTQLVIEGPTTISGYRFSKGWAADQRVYFVARFSAPIFTWLISADGEVSNERREAQGKKVKALLRFRARPGDPIIAKVALSPTGVDGARRNLDKEAAGWEFDAYRRDAEEAWERRLERIRIDTADKARKTVFYTALYHSMLAPTIFCDVDGAYRGADGQVHATTKFQHHTVFSLWDTFRALHPLLTLIQPERVNDLVQSMMAFSRESGRLPVWSLWGNETNTMIGYHAVPVVVDAVMKGLTTVDRGEAFEAMKASALHDARGLGWLKPPETRGYIPADQEPESVSKLLEYAYDDWCIAQLAAKLERPADRRFFETRAGFYKNVFDASTGFMRGRLADGSWRTPFSPRLSQHEHSDYTEGNAWQHTWAVMHDVGGLMGLMGGPDAFVRKLDELFDQPSVIEGSGASPDISGLIGQYAQGNEPSHHIAYLYAYAGAPWKTADRVRQICTTLYTTGPEGLCGNDDCGQMSAWYVFSAIGCYPVNPAEGIYVLGTPMHDGSTLEMAGGKRFEIRAEGRSDANRYIQSAVLNGRPLDRCWIRHDEIVAGGTLLVRLGPEPSRTWATAPESAPPSMTKG